MHKQSTNKRTKLKYYFWLFMWFNMSIIQLKNIMCTHGNQHILCTFLNGKNPTPLFHLIIIPINYLQFINLPLHHLLTHFLSFPFIFFPSILLSTLWTWFKQQWQLNPHIFQHNLSKPTNKFPPTLPYPVIYYPSICFNFSITLR